MSFDDFALNSTCKENEQNKKLFSQISESDTDFMIGQINCEIQIESRARITEENVTSNNANNSVAVDSFEEGVRTLERSITAKVSSEVNSVMATC